MSYSFGALFAPNPRPPSLSRAFKTGTDRRMLHCFVCSKLGVKVVDVEDIDTYEGSVLSPVRKTPGGRHLKL